MSSVEGIDLYQVLGVNREATTEDIRATYKRLAKQLHPDKQSCATAQDMHDAAERFKTVALAYSVLSDPEKRRRYDLHGPDELDDIDMDPEQFEVDLRDLGPVQKAILSVLGRTGFEFRTAVPETVTALPLKKGKDAPPLLFGAVHHGKVDRQGVQLYSLTVTHQQIEEGLVVSAYSPMGSRLKVLLFEEGADAWHLALQEDSQQLARGRLHAAGLYFLRFDTYSLTNSITDITDHTDEAELTLFSRLRSFRKRDSATLRPGKWLVGVYGDNLYKRSSYTVKVLNMGDQQVPMQHLRDVESEMLRFRRSVQELEQQYRKVQVQLSHSPLGWGASEQQGNGAGTPSASEQAQLQFERLQNEADMAKLKLDELLEGRRQAYTTLLQTISVKPPSAAHLRGDSSSEISPPVQCSRKLFSCAPDMQPLRTALHKQISGQPYDPSAELPPMPTSPNSRYNMALATLKRLSVNMSKTLKAVSRSSTPRSAQHSRQSSM